jgi:hypothetical protein
MDVLYQVIDDTFRVKLEEAERAYAIKSEKRKESNALRYKKDPSDPSDPLEYNVKKVIARIEEETEQRKKKSKSRARKCDSLKDEKTENNDEKE